jgi:BirA family biotin operon repressor/biotin-[acetyl-CoA-carboxylase] ligase
VKQRILYLLKQNEYVSGEKISQELDISRTAVWKHVEALREEGYVIDSVPRRGYKVIHTPDILYPGEIKKGLETKTLGKEIHHFSLVDSTNRVARDLAEEGAPEGTVVLAEQQSQGKGRMDRRWHSPPGGIWMSVILKPRLSPYQVQGITLVAAVAVVEAVKEVTGLCPKIKWPNDIYIEGRKVCGILTEMKGETDRVEHVVIGIGLNVNNEFKESDEPVSEGSSPVSLSMLLSEPADRKELVREILFRLEKCYFRYVSEGISSLLELWRRNNFTLGSRIILKMGDKEFSGVAEDITPEGGLILRDHQGEKKVFYSGEVTVIGHGRK